MEGEREVEDEGLNHIRGEEEREMREINCCFPLF